MRDFCASAKAQGGAGFCAPPLAAGDARLRAETKRHMGRRMHGWNYSGRGIYMITIVTEGRLPTLGRLVKSAAGEWAVEASDTGRMVEECLAEMPAQWPGVSIIAQQLMPDHLHFIVFVDAAQPKPLGTIVGSLKAKSSSRFLGARAKAQNGAGFCASALAPKNLCASALAPNAPARLWAGGYVDLVLLRRGHLEKMVAYLRDNPRRLGVKRENANLFRVLRNLEFKGMHFSAIGNLFLLESPSIFQVQCSRSLFAYRRERVEAPWRKRQGAEQGSKRQGAERWRILRDTAGKPLVEKTTGEFEAKAAETLDAAKHGAVLVSPCISHGEREIARRAFEAGHRIITLQNKGFSPIYKPGGKLFDKCAAGNLLMLAPIAWPYVPGEKPPTRESSLVLNRIAQLIVGDGAAEIGYKGATMRGIEEAVAAACGVNLGASAKAQNGTASGEAQNGAASAQAQNLAAQNGAQFCALALAPKNQGETK